jgi:hypothetical protein
MIGWMTRGLVNRESTDRHNQGEGTPGRSGRASISPCPHTGSRDQSTDRDVASPGGVMLTCDGVGSQGPV